MLYGNKVSLTAKIGVKQSKLFVPNHLLNIMLEVSLSDARNALSITHGFELSRRGIEGTLNFFHRHQCVQSDPIEVAGRNADLTLQSRVADYKQEYLYDLLYKKRRLFEYFCKMMSILPVETYPIFGHKMKDFEKKVAPFLKKHKKETQQVLKAVEKGPVSSRELTDFGKLEWGWGRRANVSNILLTRLWVAGKVMVHHREGAVKYYALPENIIPKKVLSAQIPTKGEDIKEIAKLIVKSSRLVSPSRAPEQWYDVGKTKEVRRILKELEKEGEVFSFNLHGYRDTVYAPIEDKEIWEAPHPPESDYVRFLAPLDPLNWNKALFRAIYGMEYSWEVYKKAKDRKYGYYCLPILFNGSAVGLIEPFYRKKDKVLEIRSFHVLDKKIEKNRFKRAVKAELKRFSEYLGAEKVEVKGGEKWIGGSTNESK
jgi:uncharacterized protein YcaQ